MIKNKNLLSTFLIFLLIHLTLWTLAPSMSNVNLPLDTIEALAWGSNLDWGFNKHPPFSAFAVELFYQLFGNQDWAYYLLSQIFVIVAFFVVFKLADELLKNKYLALISVLLLEGIYFYNFTTPEFNVNISQLPFWALSVYYTWRCIKFNKLLDYFLLGLFVGLGILSKYLFIYLVIGIKLSFIYFLKKGIKIKFLHLFIAGLTTFLVLSPHFIWLIKNDYVTLLYGFQRTGGIGNLIDHIIFPLSFLGKQIGILIPFFVMILFLIKKFKIKIDYKDKKLIFLVFTTLIPILLMFLTSVIIGAKIRTMWMTPFYLFLGVIFVYLFQKKIDIKKLNKFFIVFLFFLFLSPSTYLYISKSESNKRTDYPGKEIARLVQNKWDNNFRNEIKIVVGDEWAAGNLSYHLNSRPLWTNSLQNKISSIDYKKGVIYTGNPKILKEVCPGVFGKISPVGYCMIGQK
ncbi:MAG: glycosyltransferase family 39 protein [Candidatus Pelagibacter sp.]